MRTKMKKVRTAPKNGGQAGKDIWRKAGYILLSAAVMAFFAVICYAFFWNESLISENAESRLWLMLSAFGWLLAVLTILLCAAWITLTFMKAFFDVVRSMTDGKKRIEVDNPSFLKILSILLFILMTAYILIPGIKTAGWLTEIEKLHGITVPIAVLAFLLTAYVGIHIIYKFLEAFMNKESGLKKYVGKSAHMLMEMTGELLLCLLRFIRFIPEFMGWGYDLLRSDDLEDIPDEKKEEEMA